MPRLIVATILGILCGIWYHFSQSMNATATPPLAAIVGTIASVAMIGFVIGISKLRMNWAIHGVLVGILASLPTILPPLLAGDITPFVILLLFGAFYGFIIELFTTVMFGLRQED